jgi:hypothetical protein
MTFRAAANYATPVGDEGVLWSRHLSFNHTKCRTCYTARVRDPLHSHAQLLGAVHRAPERIEVAPG